MKRGVFFAAAAALSLLFLSACGGAQGPAVSAVSPDSAGSQSQTQPATGSAGDEEQRGQVRQLLEQCDHLSSGILEIALSPEERDTVADLLGVAQWTDFETPPEMGYDSDLAICQQQTGAVYLLSNGQVLVRFAENQSVLCTGAPEALTAAKSYLQDLTDQSIGAGNAQLTEQVDAFDALRCEPADSTAVQSGQPATQPLSAPASQLLQLTEWKLYRGAYSEIHCPPEESQLVLYRQLEGYPMPLTVNQINGQYVANCTFWDGPGGSMTFLIPQSAYEALLQEAQQG